jgi:hypothetical protein
MGIPIPMHRAKQRPAKVGVNTLATGNEGLMKLLFILVFVGFWSVSFASPAEDHAIKEALYFCKAFEQLKAAILIQKVKFTDARAKACVLKARALAKSGFDENEKSIKEGEKEKKFWKEMAVELSK